VSVAALTDLVSEHQIPLTELPTGSLYSREVQRLVSYLSGIASRTTTGASRTAELPQRKRAAPADQRGAVPHAFEYDEF